MTSACPAPESFRLSDPALSPGLTVELLPYSLLMRELHRLLLDRSVLVPPRLVMPLVGGGRLFVMPASDAHTAIAKLITFTPTNAHLGLATIQGDVLVFHVATGKRLALLDGPTVTARRTAAVSVLAAQRLAPCKQGPVLIVGAGVQGTAHLEAFAEGMGIKEFFIASRSLESAERLVAHAHSLGLMAHAVPNPDAALAECPMAVTCTPASGVVLSALPRHDGFIAAIGAFTPQMVELSPGLCRHVAAHGTVVLDTQDAAHEAGDLLQAGLDVSTFASLADVVSNDAFTAKGPVLFKSCGWAGWDLAAARTAVARMAASQ